MFSHTKALITPVEVTTPDPQFAQFLLDQFGGATGELRAALQYWVQSFHVEDPAIRDMLQDIAVEEFSHLEVVGMLIQQHSQGSMEEKAWRSTLFAVLQGGTSSGSLEQRAREAFGQDLWTAACETE